MRYISTRNKKESITATEAIVRGISLDGGLFVPESFPMLSIGEIGGVSGLEYFERAAYIINKFIPEMPYEELKGYCQKAYERFDGDPAPVVMLDDNLYILELWHGPTYAFKDIALTLLPYLMTASKKINGISDLTHVLVATSGDTGKAALEGFKDVEGTKITVLYPSEGVSDLQKLQMMTTTGDNVKVYGVKGNFDDTQTAVKTIFADKEIVERLKKENVSLSSANSINFGRLVPQIVYYFSAYADIVDSGKIKLGDKINFCVPCGNFGNILAGYYAKRMGLPINRLICASNKNNVLTDFFESGNYNAKREFFKTSSPSMDILISSNLERLVFEFSNRDDELTARRMKELKEKGSYSISKEELNSLGEEFYASFAEEDSVKETIAGFFDEYGYVLDPHTAVAVSVLDEYDLGGEDIPTVVISTASPIKFVSDVMNALEIKSGADMQKNLKKFSEETAFELPDSIVELFKLPVKHKDVIEKEKATKII